MKQFKTRYAKPLRTRRKWLIMGQRGAVFSLHQVLIFLVTALDSSTRVLYFIGVEGRNDTKKSKGVINYSC